jgi:hypothetical protein
LAVPILSADGVVLGTLGVGKITPHNFSDAEKERLVKIGLEFESML